MKLLLSRFALLCFVISIVTCSLIEDDPLKGYPVGLLKIASAYPDFILQIDRNGILMRDSTYFIWDDGLIKSDSLVLLRPDLEDMMKYNYLGDKTPNPPDSTQKAGRFRHEPFLMHMYGSTEKEVKANLKSITWLPGITKKIFKVNKMNGAADSLQKISIELTKLDSSLIKYVNPTGGIFNWRQISGSDRISMHSLAIAIDINPKFGHYWDWDMVNHGHLKYRNLYPMEIIRIFEKYGWIWGGRWYKYDTMHFEFRPELTINPNRLRVTDFLTPMPRLEGSLLPMPKPNLKVPKTPPTDAKSRVRRRG
jgi:peptidoglycan LD-endopeptidase CwlK